LLAVSYDVSRGVRCEKWMVDDIDITTILTISPISHVGTSRLRNDPIMVFGHIEASKGHLSISRILVTLKH